MRINTTKVKEIMEQQNLKIEDICHRTGLYKKSIQWILENGAISEEALERIADAVGVEVREIYLPDASAFEENVIEFITGHKRATVTVSRPKFITMIQKLAESHPEECEIVAINYDPKKDSKKESVVAHVPVKWVKIKPGMTLTDEERIARGERMRSGWNTGDLLEENE